MSPQLNALVPSAPPAPPVLESPPIAKLENEARRDQFPSQYQLQQIQQIHANIQQNHAQQQQQQQQHQQLPDIALNSEFVSLTKHSIFGTKKNTILLLLLYIFS